jgi:hypothetical protein
MMAYGGVDNGLFQAAFLDSGAATGLTPIPKPDYPTWQWHYDNITSITQYVSFVFDTGFQLTSAGAQLHQILLSVCKTCPSTASPRPFSIPFGMLIRFLTMRKPLNFEPCRPPSDNQP